MTSTRIGLALALALASAGRGARAGETVAWRPSLAQAFEEAKASGKPVFVAINAERVDGGRVEPASRLLREEVYLHPTVVARSRDLVCVLLRDPISDADGAELRARFGVEGLIVSPQHLLAHADGSPIHRQEYWPHGDVESSVAALTALFTRAVKASEVRRALPARGKDPASKAAWFEAALAIARAGPDADLRRAAVREILAADEKGDAHEALGRLLKEAKDPKKEDLPILVDVARLLGVPGAERGVAGLSAALDAKDPGLRAEAAVSLEYVGAPAAAAALAARLPREKDETVRSDVCRALGRCGAKDAAARVALVKELRSARSDRAAAAALVGLSYREGDAEAARAVESCARKDDRGLRVAALAFALGEIGDAKSAEALRALEAAAGKDEAIVACVRAAAARHGTRTEEARRALAQCFHWTLVRDAKHDPARSGRRAGFVPNADLGGD